MMRKFSAHFKKWMPASTAQILHSLLIISLIKYPLEIRNNAITNDFIQELHFCTLLHLRAIIRALSLATRLGNSSKENNIEATSASSGNLLHIEWVSCETECTVIKARVGHKAVRHCIAAWLRWRRANTHRRSRKRRDRISCLGQWLPSNERATNVGLIAGGWQQLTVLQPVTKQY